MKTFRCFALVVAMLSAPSIAHAGDSKKATELFREARRLLEKNHPREACPLLEQSLALEPLLVTRLNLAACYDGTGRSAPALREFRAAMKQARAEHNDDLARVAGERADELAPKTHRLVLEVRAQEKGEEILLDGKRIEPQDLDPDLPMDPGSHVVEAIAPGRKPWREAFVVEGGARVLRIAVPSLTVSEPAKEPARAPDSPERARLSPLVYVFGGVSLVALGSFAFFAIKGQNGFSELRNGCGQTLSCKQSDVDAVHTEMLVADISLGVGVVAAGIATWFVVFPPTTNAPAIRAAIRPYPGGIGAVLAGEL